MVQKKSNQNKVYEPNYTQIPNILFDYWMPKLSAHDFKVLLAIARKTCGWHKNADRISLSQLMNICHMSKAGIVHSLKRLEDLKLIKKIKSKSSKGDCNTNTYELIIHAEEGGISEDQGVVCQKDYPSLPERLPVVCQADTQKKPIQKKPIQKKQQPPTPIKTKIVRNPPKPLTVSLSQQVPKTNRTQELSGGGFLSEIKKQEIKSILDFCRNSKLPFSEFDISRWVEKFSGAKVIEKINLYKQQQIKAEKGQSKEIRDPARWIGNALKNDYI